MLLKSKERDQRSEMNNYPTQVFMLFSAKVQDGVQGQIAFSPTQLKTHGKLSSCLSVAHGEYIILSEYMLSVKSFEG